MSVISIQSLDDSDTVTQDLPQKMMGIQMS